MTVLPRPASPDEPVNVETDHPQEGLHVTLLSCRTTSISPNAGNAKRIPPSPSPRPLLTWPYAPRTTHLKEVPMGFSDKMDNSKDQAAGKAKQAYGDATDNEEMQAEGSAQESKGDLKAAGEKVKDAFKN